MTERVNVQSGRLEYESTSGNLEVIIRGDLTVVGNAGSVEVTQGSLQVKDISLITNFGEYGPHVTIGDGVSGLLVDRGMYSLVKVPDIINPDNFPSTFMWVIEEDVNGKALLRSDPAAHPGWRFPSGNPSDATGAVADVVLPSITSPASLTWVESSYSWDLNYNFNGAATPSPLSTNPRVLNVGLPLGDSDLTAATNVQWVATKLTEFKDNVLSSQFELEDLANVDDAPASEGDLLTYHGGQWISSNMIEGSLTLTDSTVPSTITLNPTDGMHIDTGGDNEVIADGTLTLAIGDSLVSSAKMVISSTSIVCTDTISAPAFTVSSALKYKEDVHEFNDAIDKVMKIDVITYLRKGVADDKRYLGVSADSMAKVVPELVNFVGGEPDSVNYAQGFALVVRAMQEQEERRLKSQIKRIFKQSLEWISKW